MRYALALCSVFVYLVFLLTSCPTIYLGDGGEMVTTAFTLGIGHPPGYPVFMMLAKIFTSLPMGDIAFRVNLLAAAAGAFVFIMMYFTALYLACFVFGRKQEIAVKLAALFAAFIFVFSYMTWSQAVQAKGAVYLITHFAELSGILFCVKFIAEKKLKYFYLAAFTAGFMPALHHSAALIMFFIVVTLAFNMKAVSGRQKAAGAAFFLMSLITPHLYLFIRAKASPVVHWGDIETAGQVLNHITRKVYSAALMGPFNADVAFSKIRQYLWQFLYSYRAAAVLPAVGMVFLFKHSRKTFYVLAAFIITNLAGLLYLTGYSPAPFMIYMNSGFYVIIDVVLALSAAIGAYGLINLINKKQGPVRLAAAAALFLMPAWQLISFYGMNDQSRKFLAYDNAVNVLKTAGSGSRIFAEEDFQVFDILYLKYARHMFREVHAYDRSANFLDTSIFDKFRDAGAEARLSGKAHSRAELNYMMREYTMKLERMAEYAVQMQNPERTYYTTIYDIPQAGFGTRPYGIIYKMERKTAPEYDASSLMDMYSIRDYFNNGKLDLYYRDVAARYFVQRAKYAAMKKSVEAGYYCGWAEKIAGDSGAVLNLIAEIYYSDLKDTGKAIEYMEKIMYLNPYDYAALDVLVRFCLQSDGEKAVKWLRHYYKIALSEDMKNAILIQINKISN